MAVGTIAGVVLGVSAILVVLALVLVIANSANSMHKGMKAGEVAENACGNEYTERDTPRYFIFKAYDDKAGSKLASVMQGLNYMVTVLACAFVISSLIVTYLSYKVGKAKDPPRRWYYRGPYMIFFVVFLLLCGAVTYQIMYTLRAVTSTIGLGTPASTVDELAHIKTKARLNVILSVVPTLAVVVGLLIFWKFQAANGLTKLQPLWWMVLVAACVILVIFVLQIIAVGAFAEVQDSVERYYSAQNSVSVPAQINTALQSFVGITAFEDFMKQMIRRVEGDAIDGNINLDGFADRFYEFVPHAGGKELLFLESGDTNGGVVLTETQKENLKTVRNLMSKLRTDPRMVTAVHNLARAMYYNVLTMLVLVAFLVFHIAYGAKKQVTTIVASGLIFLFMLIIMVYAWVITKIRD